MTQLTTYIGDTIPSEMSFRDANGTLFDPITIVAVTTSPAAIETLYTFGTDNEIINTATGIYEGYFPVNESGIWAIRWQGTFTNSGATVKLSLQTKYKIVLPEDTTL